MFEEFGSGAVYSKPVRGNFWSRSGLFRIGMWWRRHFTKMPAMPDSPVVVIDKDGARGIPAKQPGWPGGRMITPADLERMLGFRHVSNHPGTKSDAFISERKPDERTVILDGEFDLVSLAAEINCFFSRVEL
jgi:hypothetical protein